MVDEGFEKALPGVRIWVSLDERKVIWRRWVVGVRREAGYAMKKSRSSAHYLKNSIFDSGERYRGVGEKF